jgi:hypothetical protein
VKAPVDVGSRKGALWGLLLVTLLGVGGWLRLAGGNWDRGLQLNVDDTFVAKTAQRRVNLPPGTTLATLLTPAESPINPRAGGDFFPYGTLPIYITKGTASLLSGVTGSAHFTGFGGVQLTGRALSGLFDLLAVLLLTLLGARLWGRWWGLLTGALYAFAILPIQVSHFFITDSFMAAFTTAALLFSVLLVREGMGLPERRRGQLSMLALAGGLCVGLAMSSKLSAAPALVLPVGAALVFAARGVGTAETGLPVRLGSTRWLLPVVVLVGTFAGLFAGDPYAVLDPAPYLAQLGEQAAIQNGQIDEWFTRKYVGSWPVLHSLGQLLLLGVGPLVGLAGALGVGVAAREGWRERGRDWAWPLIFVGAVAYFGAVGFAEAKWVRYLLPLVPYLCLFATAFCVWAWGWLAARQAPTAARAALPGVLAVTALLGALAVMPIYRTEHTQIAASRWIYENVPEGSAIGIETTAIRMPLDLPGQPDPAARYTFGEWNPLADGPSGERAEALRAYLEGSDYLILDTTQALRTAPRLPWRYPVQVRYYDLLFRGQLGFTLVHRATSYPRLGPVEFPDEGWADVSFMDSSHPPITIFRKERELSAEEWSILMGEAASRPSSATRQRP